MSKMSQLHAELTEQASRLGFQSIEEAEENGYEVDYTNGVLVDGRELAHAEYINKRKEVLDELEKMRQDFVLRNEKDWERVIEATMELINQGEL